MLNKISLKFKFFAVIFALLFLIIPSTTRGCPPCPEISCAIRIKVEEIRLYMYKHYLDLWVIHFSKDLKKEDLYHLYKVLMLKSLGERHVVNYPSLLLEKSLFDERREIEIVTDDDFTFIHQYRGNRPGLWRSNPYIWDWKKWLNNILYKTEIDCTATIENDPATFYLRKPDSDQIIIDALFKLAHRRKQADIQYTEFETLLKEEESFHSLLDETRSFMKKIIDEFHFEEVLANNPLEELYNCVNEKEIIPGKTSMEDAIEMCGLSANTFPEIPDWTEIELKHPSDYLSCGMEIPIGETFQLVWDHFIELLFAMDGYIFEGLLLLEYQSIMNEMVLECYCLCTCCCPCGSCYLTCDKEAIRRFYCEYINWDPEWCPDYPKPTCHQMEMPQRQKMECIAEYIEHLTHGFFHHPSENICHRLNEDIRDEAEKRFCLGGGSHFITMHELVTRKLNYSRHMFDECATRPEQREDTIEGLRAGKAPVFGPIAEREDLERYTKTKVEGAAVNTHDYNWFCCSYAQPEEGIEEQLPPGILR